MRSGRRMAVSASFTIQKIDACWTTDSVGSPARSRRSSSPENDAARAARISQAPSRAAPFQRGESRAHADRIRAEGACLVDRSFGSHERHQVGPSRVGANREASADDLAEGHQVRHETEQASGACTSTAEACDDLVEDDERARTTAGHHDVREPFEALRQQAVVGRHRLENNRRQLVAGQGQHAIQRGLVVERRDQGVRGDVAWQSRARGGRRPGKSAARLDE